ncbi:MAG: RagB/SusD family nutrient uptake outer membrane protein, partial [Muribaculaceae bacterium]|nr:RagB/SusD family nutrient uptake outer membrane protein [Muribaculaceae bacterium]
MKKFIKYTPALVLLAMTTTGCNDFLDTMPDNRATLNSEEKIAAMLTSGYFKNDYVVVSELASDNTDDLGANNPYTT